MSLRGSRPILTTAFGDSNALPAKLPVRCSNRIIVLPAHLHDGLIRLFEVLARLLPVDDLAERGLDALRQVLAARTRDALHLDLHFAVDRDGDLELARHGSPLLGD